MTHRKDIPRISVGALPEEEQAEARHLFWLLAILHSRRCDFTSGLNLMMEANEARKGNQSAIRPIVRDHYNSPDFNIEPHDEIARGWRKIGMMHAAFTIYNFGRTLDGIKKSAYKCSTIIEKVDVDKLNAAQPLFTKCFPTWDRIRKAIAHIGDISHSRASVKKARSRQPMELGGVVLHGVSGGGIAIHGWMIYLTIDDGDIVAAEVSPTKHAEMIAIVDLVYEAFSAFRPTLREDGEPG